jgi:hypothetical protein
MIVDPHPVSTQQRAGPRPRPVRGGQAVYNTEIGIDQSPVRTPQSKKLKKERSNAKHDILSGIWEFVT